MTTRPRKAPWQRKLATAIRTRRIARMLTQQAAAEETGVDRRTWINYETGDREPSATMLGRIAVALCCSADALLGVERG